MNEGRGSITAVVVAAAAFALVVILVLMAGLPMYRVWQREMSGKAQLAEAEWNRQIRVREAQAELESAAHLANAEIERARGVAEANRIIASGLGGPEGYLHYLWIQSVDSADVIYVPTEAQLPILEAGRIGTRGTP